MAEYLMQPEKMPGKTTPGYDDFKFYYAPPVSTKYIKDAFQIGLKTGKVCLSQGGVLRDWHYSNFYHG